MLLKATAGRRDLRATDDRAATASVATAGADALPSLVIFGDSLSDTGNSFKSSKGQVPSPDAYWRGRFCNGPVWVDHLARLSPTLASGGDSGGFRGSRDSSDSNTAIPRVRVHNYAVGGAMACPGPALLPVPSLDQQVTAFLSGDPGADVTRVSSVEVNNSQDDIISPCLPRDASSSGSETSTDSRLFVVFIGHNDLLYLRDWTDPRVVQRVVANITACRVAALDRLLSALSSTDISKQRQPEQQQEQQQRTSNLNPLSDRGATNPPRSTRSRIVVWNLAPVENAPGVPAAIKPAVAAAVTAHNEALEASLAPLRGRYPGGPELMTVFDAYAAATCVASNARRLGFTDTEDPCLRVDKADADTSGAARPSMAAGGVIESTTARGSDVCSSPDRHLWFDSVHPTSRAHLLGLAQPFGRAVGWR